MLQIFILKWTVFLHTTTTTFYLPRV